MRRKCISALDVVVCFRLMPVFILMALMFVDRKAPV